MSTSDHFTECGLPGIQSIPYGVHMCHFYEGHADLASRLVPYFTAGLRRGERCVWVTADPLGAEQAAAALQASGLDVDAAQREKKLIIRDHSDWYGRAEKLDARQLAALWFDEERSALAGGHRGLRITGNSSFVSPTEWDAFMTYESLIDREFQEHQIVTLCSYRFEKCGPSEVLDVMRRHACSLERPDHGWRVVARR